jgi:hypothetical protein
MTGLPLGIIFTSSLSLISVIHRDIISVHVPIGCRKIKDVSIILQEYNCENIFESSGCVEWCFHAVWDSKKLRKAAILTLLKTKRKPFYLETQFVPRSKHFPSRL